MMKWMACLSVLILGATVSVYAQTPAGGQPRWTPPSGSGGAAQTTQPARGAYPARSQPGPNYPSQPAAPAGRYGAQPQGHPAGGQPAHPATGRAGAPTAAGTPTMQPANSPRAAGPAAPFVLSQREQAELDQVLRRWEQFSEQVAQFECDFVSFDYMDGTANPLVAKGLLQYEAPDKGRYELIGRLNRTGQPGSNNYVLQEGVGAEKWISDGTALYRYDFARKVITKHPLSEEMRGKGITDGPLPFVFGAKAANLKSRYFMRIITPRDEYGRPHPAVKGQVWIDAWPRTRRDASEFLHAEIILLEETMQPMALKLHHLNGKSNTTYRFENAQVNHRKGGVLSGIAGFFGGDDDPFKVNYPSNEWTMVIKNTNQEAAMAPGGYPQR